MSRPDYIHGTDRAEQTRLALLNRLTNPPFLDLLRPEEGRAILEVGSGLGILARETAQRAPDSLVVGVEYSADQLAAADRSRPNLRFAQGDAHRLPFRDGRFHLVYCRYVLEHVGDPEQALREMRRVLRPGGRAVTQENNILINVFDPECPAFDAVWRRFVELQRRLGGDALIGRRLFALMKRAGFRDIELSLQPEVHWSGKPTFRPWVENLMGNVEGAAARLIDHGLTTADEIRASSSELTALMERDDASAIFYWNRAVGVK